MGLKSFLQKQLTRVSPRVMAVVEKQARKIPFVNRRIEHELDEMMAGFAASLKPYRDDFATYRELPGNGRAHTAILADMQAMQQQEEAGWRDGYASGAVYHGDAAHIEFLNEVYALHSQTNPLHADLWPSIGKYEAEVVSMTAHMLGASHTDDEIVGTVSSGGTESILLAMKTYRDWARETKGITAPEMIVPVTAHAAFWKAAQYFNIKLVTVPVDGNGRADWIAAKNAINKNSVVLAGSAPTFPHGVMDPISEMAALAQEAGIGFHTDACLGGFVLPWAEKLGYPVPPFDFRLPGVTSMSVDTHKYGYAAKGASVVLYRGRELRHFQYFAVADWPGGLYTSPTFAGSRPGALSATTWAAMLAMGEDGYLAATERILQTAASLREAIATMPDLQLIGDSLFVVPFASQTVDIYRVLDGMAHKGWSLNGLHHPTCIHLAVTLRHTQPGVVERFLADLEEVVTAVKSTPASSKGMAPVYGMAATIPAHGLINDMLKRYIDAMYEVW